MRGELPNGVIAPRGLIRVTLSPTLTPSDCASPVPIATPPELSKSMSAAAILDGAGDLFHAEEIRAADAAHQHAGAAGARPEASAWPSIIGIADFTPGTAAMRFATSS